MRICLITDQYPARDDKDRSSQYMTDLAQGLDALGHDVTVLCSKTARVPSEGRIQVVIAQSSKSLGDLKMSSRLMPDSVRFCSEQLGYWHALSELGGQAAFEVVEASQPQACALLGAFSREIPAVLRVETEEKPCGDDFDEQFSRLILDYAYSCIDLFSCAASKDTVYLQHARKLDALQMTVNSSSERSELAGNAIKIYESAIDRFQSATKPHLYRHGAQRMIQSTEDMLRLYDRMLYELLFRVSYRFRVEHWLRKLSSDPGAFIARVLQRFGQKV